MSAVRQERVEKSVREAVARILQEELHDARLGFVTVTHVKMSADLKHARIFVSMLTEGPARDAALTALEASRGFIRRRAGQMLRLRFTPEIAFTLDTTIEYGARIESLIQQTHDKHEDGDEEPGPVRSS